jgi:hypothetical protein
MLAELSDDAERTNRRLSGGKLSPCPGVDYSSVR